MPSTTTLWLRLLLFFVLLLPTGALSSRLEMRQDTLPSQTIQVGQAPTPAARTEPKRRTHPLALVSLGATLIMLVNLATSPNLALFIVACTVATVTGLISHAKIKRDPKALKGRGWAMLGLLTGGILLMVVLGGFLIIELFKAGIIN